MCSCAISNVPKHVRIWVYEEEETYIHSPILLFLYVYANKSCKAVVVTGLGTAFHTQIDREIDE